ncbi:acyl-CoA dehydrogenase [Nocardioides humi]|uniref:Acyl-CoA dehydrogenase n=1 Tax=Nocardioides humi TaxID=449461 RepID=A0ABN2BWU5_9ACTN|nr:acyl-CoA dehydrogenase [Nocardioides humi]
MTETLVSRRDLDFLLFEWLRVDALLERERFAEHSVATFKDVLALSEQIATTHFAPHNRKGDLEEPRLVDGEVHLLPEIAPALRAYAEAGLVGATMDHAVGGFQLPQTVFDACTAWFYAANMSTAAYNLLTIGNANLLLAHGTPEQVETFVVPMVEGRYFGTMALSEPQAGSSLADITTRAVPQADGSYRLFGDKMWISGADHRMGENIVHLVLAKAPGGGPGTRGISLFIVPKVLTGAAGAPGVHNDVVVTGLNHKMGARGTVNTVLALGDGTHSPGGQPGAIGYLVGEEHRGLSYMFHMMNEARVGIGLSGAALGYTGYLKSLAYARSRPQGRPLGQGNPDSPQVPLVEHVDVRRMLLTQKSYVEGALALVLYCGRLLDEERSAPDPAARERAAALLGLLTPIAKSWPAQWCLRANELAIQVHGGAGYTRDYDVEQHYRDNRLNPIHEGTHGIQALDLLNRKVVGDGGAALGLLAGLVEETAARATAASVPELGALAADLTRDWERLAEVSRRLAEVSDPAERSANASVYLEAAGHLVVAWIWLEQALATAGREEPFYRGKRAAAAHFFSHELPHARAQLELLMHNRSPALAVHADEL